ncbi:hypothetical protein HMPREF9372_0931 [Sporosarcina newyorkensis 2681]|uniref:Uncharacterized protein n=1 Tax=Sporosarcina newyorkensis 2681 TaxID=1027292 RepID=F9DQ51_9BACL|nr:hypothetical protein [Sporosarcina newyorkensis]EGQ27074.1 hypothetical protein HMPREF9372_0931 [Sporosarcina newyorkensis 2681]
MEIDVKILGVKKLEFEKDDKQIKGTKVYYTAIDNTDANIIGYNVISAWFNGFEMFERLKGENIPGDYKLLHSIKLQGSKPVVQVNDFLSVIEK